MNNIKEFLKEYDYVTLNAYGEDTKVFSVDDVIKELDKIGVKEIHDTYWDEIVFEGNDGEVYQIIAM